jgi:PAS domain S-box-containing protein
MDSFGKHDEPLSILLIEDNYDDVELLEFQLDSLIKQGMKFSHSDSLASGILRLEAGDIKLVLLDLSLPDSAGVATVVSVRRSSPMIPIIVLTGTEDDQLAVQALAHGAQDYLIKGEINLPSLCRSINYAIARQSIVEVSERLAAIVESSDDAIIGKTIKGTITSWNSGAQRLFGYSATEASGRSVGMLMPPESAGELPDILARLSKGEVIHKETIRVAKNGQKVAVSETISPIRTNGQITGAAAIERDITERKRAEQELKDTEKRLSLALRAAEVGVWDLDFAKNSVWRSLRHDEIFGHSKLLPEWNFDIFIKYVLPEDREYAHQAFQRGVKLGQYRMECRIVRASDCAVRWILALGETFKDAQGNPERMMGTVLDITDRKAQEEHERLMAVLKEREDFMTTLTHDMKNPLIGANRLLELLIKGNLGELTSKQCELLRSLEQGNAGVLDLIANLTDIYRMEQKCDSLLIEDIDPAIIITSCIERIKCFAVLRDITVTSHLPTTAVPLQADPKRVARILHNLLDNALKFTPDKGAIEVRLLVQDGQVVIEVEDNGAGIANDELPYLFKRFSQGKAGRRCTGGTGLGLYLCRQIAEAHGGTIHCQSNLPFSTVFRLCLPANAREAA